MHNQKLPNIQTVLLPTVYMDGSAIEGGIGVVAVLFQGSIKQRVAWKYMGTMDEHMVFEAKLLGAAMMRMLWQEGAGKHMIATDHQAAILTTREEQAISGQNLVNTLHMQVETLGIGVWQQSHSEMGARSKAMSMQMQRPKKLQKGNLPVNKTPLSHAEGNYQQANWQSCRGTAQPSKHKPRNCSRPPQEPPTHME